jgi:hypothetical protein
MLGDARIAAAAPATFVMSRESYMHCGGAQDAEQIWPGLTAAGFDHEDVVLAMAPRPVLVLAVTSDFFPIEGTRRTVDRCRRFWELCGRDGDLDLVEDNSDHHYTPLMARAAAQFFSRHLLDRQQSAHESPALQLFEPGRLWCTASGQVRGELEGAGAVYEENQQRLQELEAQRMAIPPAARRQRAVQWLRNRVVSNRRPCALNPRFYLNESMEELQVQMGLWWSQERLFNHGYLVRYFEHVSSSPENPPLPVTLAIWDGGTNVLQRHLSWLRQTCAQRRAVLVLDVSGSGGLLARSHNASPTEGFFGIMHKLADDLFWLDDDLASLRIHDVLRALDMIEQWPGLDASDIQIYAHGRHGLYGRLATLLDNRIRKTEVHEGLESYARWISERHYDAYHIKDIIIHGILKYFDLPELEDERIVIHS